jgi:hypothetical protein
MKKQRRGLGLTLRVDQGNAVADHVNRSQKAHKETKT